MTVAISGIKHAPVLAKTWQQTFLLDCYYWTVLTEVDWWKMRIISIMCIINITVQLNIKVI
jgi:hypothetical protein